MSRRLLCVLLLGLAACSKPEPQRPKNVILVLVDTLRADHLGTYGYSRPTSPNVDAFARESLKFENARSQASCTFPSANSILTSRYPSAFLGQPAAHELGIPDSIPSIAEILKHRGFRTAAVSASPVVRNTPGRFNPGAGFGRGFDTFHEDCVWKPAGCVNRAAFPLLQATDDRPFFLYLHYLDPHGPYRPPKSQRGRWAKGRPDKEFIRAGDPNPIGDMIYKGAPDPGLKPSDIEYLVGLYDEEIASFDNQFANLLKELKRTGKWDDTLLIFTADHGEEFLEHGHIKHCRTLYDSSIRIPMFIHFPGVEPKVLKQPVQNLDLVPTILDYLGIDAKGLKLEGESLRPLIEGTGNLDPHQYGMQGTLRSASDDRHKLIHDLGKGSFELYDLQADPREKTDRLRQDRRAFHGLRELLTSWLGRTEGKGKAEESLEAERKLRSLGYIE
ncbi:MAG TPA: sulfatase [Thermoanaerobaculia bacterium]|jgi:arylsulfatase A-like enzyme|nr:sulfatase [Thermoanaerobaculia bacterium]